MESQITVTDPIQEESTQRRGPLARLLGKKEKPPAESPSASLAEAQAASEPETPADAPAAPEAAARGENTAREETGAPTDATNAPAPGETGSPTGEKEAGEETTDDGQEDGAAALCRTWADQARDLQRLFPDFRLDRALENRTFRALLRVPGMDLPTAFLLTGRRHLLPAALRALSRQTARQVARQVASGGLRPRESAVSDGAASQACLDVRGMSRADRREIAQRAARGERIVL